jgi:hypothetical protein
MGYRIRVENYPRVGCPDNLNRSGKVAQMQAIFNTRINDYRSPDGKEFYSASVQPTIPSEISGKISAMIGLTSSKQYAPLFKVGKILGEAPVLKNADITSDTAGGTGPGGRVLRCLQWCGVVYLMFLGAMLLISAFRSTAVAAEMPQTKSLHPIAQGLTTQLGNPKALLYWTALFPQFIDRTHPPFAQFLVFGIVTICVETVVLTSYAFAAASLRRAVSRQPFMQRLLKGVTGCFFILTGLLLGRRTANA